MLGLPRRRAIAVGGESGISVVLPAVSLGIVGSDAGNGDPGERHAGSSRRRHQLLGDGSASLGCRVGLRRCSSTRSRRSRRTAPPCRLQRAVASFRWLYLAPHVSVAVPPSRSSSQLQGAERQRLSFAIIGQARVYDRRMPARVVILGAGFGGLELATMLSEALGEEVDVTLIDKSDAFVFGYSKLDVMFGRTTLDEVRLPYADIAKPGVRFLRQTITAIDSETRRVSTDGGVYDADFLVVALGADYDLDATPGLAEAGDEFYSVAGATRLAEMLPTFSAGRVIVGVCGAPFKCPPAPSEAALLLHDYLVDRGIREAV